MVRVFLCCLFFFSGAAALSYEVVWQRRMMLVFGASAPAISAVLTAFMAGLAIGSVLFGRWADRLVNTVRTYAVVELGIGLSALAMPALLDVAGAAYVWVYRTYAPSPAIYNLVRFALCVAVLLIPTTLMGATVPLMGRLVTRSDRSLGRDVGLFYAVNTLGAVAGCAVSGYVAIRTIGMAKTTLLAVGINLAIAAGAWLVAGLPAARTAPLRSLAEADRQAVRLGSRQRVLVALAGLSGLCALGYEVLWARVIAIHTTSSILAFTTMLTVFLLGIAAGSWIYSLVLDRPGLSRVVFVWGQFLIGLYALLLLWLFRWLPGWLYEAGFAGPRVWSGRVAAGEVLLSMGIIFPPTLLMGALFPAVVRLVAESGVVVGRRLSWVYSVNTVGAIIGAAATGMVVLPIVGLQRANYGYAMTNMAIGLVAALVLMRRPVLLAVYAALALVAGRVTVGAAGQVRHLKEAVRRAMPSPALQVLYYRDGPTGTVSVHLSSWRGRSRRELYIDSQPVASTYPAAVADAKMLAHLPLLLHPQPRLALTVGLGSGGTSYSMSCHGVEVDCVEIEPAVVEAARRYFASSHRGVFGNPRYRLIIDDARNWLTVTPRRYDVISTDCTNLQYKSNGSLYTVEYFRLLQSRLAPGGVAAAWIPGGAIETAEFKTVIALFLRAFPHTSAWYIPTALTDFFILIGTAEPLRIDLQQLERRMARPEVAQDLRRIGIDSPERFLATFLLGHISVIRFVAGAPLHTDDRPILEYRTARTYYRRTHGRNLRALLAYGDRIEDYLVGPVEPGRLARIRLAARWARSLSMAHAFRHDGRYDLARRYYAEAVRLHPHDRFARRCLRELGSIVP
ncbi:MAG: fused MFS/spermidine synthase [Phycisphaerae bacterium]